MASADELIDELMEKCKKHEDPTGESDTMLVGDPALLGTERGMLPLPLLNLSAKIGGAIYCNSLVCGYIARLIGWEMSPLETALTRIFTDSDLLVKNCAAARLGWEYGADRKSGMSFILAFEGICKNSRAARSYTGEGEQL